MISSRLLIVIPARYASTRFPGKPLADINGKPMVQHVYERCIEAQPDAKVLVATDDERIELAVRNFGGIAVMTPSTLQSGSERVAWVAEDTDADIIVNVQGDEPLLPAKTLHAALAALQSDEDVDIGTAACPFFSPSEALDPNIVKVVLDAQSRALYFSRAAIPHNRDEKYMMTPRFRHIGIYAFRREALLRFASLPPGRLEFQEKLEQLRALEHGMVIGVGLTQTVSQAVDTPEDLERIKALLF